MKLETGEGIEEANKKQDIQDKINKDNINTLLSQNLSYESLTLTSGLVSEINNSNQLVDVSQLNTASFLLDITTYPIYNKVNLKGYAMNKYMIIYADSNRNVLGKEPQNLAYYGDDVYLNIPKGTKYIAFNFYDVTNHPAEVKIMKITSFGGETSDIFYTEVNESIYLNQDGSITPALTSGYYFLKDHTLYYYDSNGNTTDDNRFYNSLLYVYSTISEKAVDLVGVNNDPTQIYHSIEYNSTNHYWTPDIVTIQEVVQNFTGNFSEVQTSIPSSGDNNNIPTIDAVRTYVGSHSGSNFYTEIDENITLNANGTSSYTFTDKTYYYLKPSRTITYYDDSNTTVTTSKFADSIFYYEGDSTTKTLNRTGINTDDDDIGNEQLFWTSSNNYWTELYVNKKWFVQNSHVGSNVFTRDSIPASGNNNDVPTINAVRSYVPTIATSISSTSTNSEVAGAKAVYDNSLDIYSATERRIGTWINGKPLYERTISGTTPTVTTDGTAANSTADISSDKVDFGFILASFVDKGSTGSTWTTPYYSNAMNYVKTSLVYEAGVQSKRLQINSDGTAYNNATYYCIVRYTKTNDSGT